MTPQAKLEAYERIERLHALMARARIEAAMLEITRAQRAATPIQYRPTLLSMALHTHEVRMAA